MLANTILKTGRHLRGMTQVEVAEIYGVAARTYWRWEKGDTAISYDDVVGICEQVFKIPLIEIQRLAQFATPIQRVTHDAA